MTTTTNESYSKINVILDKPSQWIQWFSIVKIAAKNHQVWQYIDPSKKKDELPVLEGPIRPTPADVLATATSAAQLEGSKLTAYNQIYAEYKDDLRVFLKRQDALANLDNHIMRTVSITNLPLIDDLETTYERLQALKKSLAPTDSSRKHEVLNQYTNLKTYNKKQNLENWLNSWRNVYKLAEKLNLPDVQEFRPHYDFMRAIKPSYSGYADALALDLIRKERNGETAPSIIDLIEEFKEHCRMQETVSSTTDVNHSAFATLQGNSPVLSTKICLCGEEHLFRECKYLIESLRPRGWVPDEKIQQQIDEKLIRYERLAAAVEKARKETSQRMPTTAADEENIEF